MALNTKKNFFNFFYCIDKKNMQTISTLDKIIIISIKKYKTQVVWQRANLIPAESLPSVYLTK